MTISIDGTDLGEVIEIASIVGGLITFLLVALVVYLLVRPPRRRRIEARREAEALGPGEMLALVERMERRIEVLERAVAAEAKDESKVVEAGEGPELRRIK